MTDQTAGRVAADPVTRRNYRFAVAFAALVAGACWLLAADFDPAAGELSPSGSAEFVRPN